MPLFRTESIGMDDTSVVLNVMGSSFSVVAGLDDVTNVVSVVNFSSLSSSDPNLTVLDSAIFSLGEASIEFSKLPSSSRFALSSSLKLGSLSDNGMSSPVSRIDTGLSGLFIVYEETLIE